MLNFFRVAIYGAVGLAGFILIMYVTTPYGPGVSGDSVDYLSTADNLISSLRFVGYDGQPYIYWPPLYPMLLAITSQITSLDTLEAGRVLNAASFGVIVLLSGLLFQGSFDDSPVWFIIGILFAFTAIPILILSANIASDPLFIVFVLGYALLGRKFLLNPTFSKLIMLGILAGVASILRWHGVILIASVFLLAMIAYRRNIKTALLNAFLVGSIALLPFLGWVLGRNYLIYSTLLGYRDTAAINYSFNISDAITKISHWLIPQQILQYSNPLFMGLFLGLCLMLLIWRSHWKNIISNLNTPSQIPLLIFTPILLLFVIFTSIPYDHAAHDDRYYAPIYIFLMVFLIQLVLELVVKPLHQILGKKLDFIQKLSVNSLTLIALLIWCVYPGYRLYKYTFINQTQGESYYNIYNTRQMQESELVTYLQDKPFDIGKPIYSNYSAALYFHTKRIAHRSPWSSSSESRNLEGLDNIKNDWPPPGGAYLVWFLPSQWHQHYTPDELSQIVDLTEIYSSSDGKIFLIQSKR